MEQKLFYPGMVLIPAPGSFSWIDRNQCWIKNTKPRLIHRIKRSILVPVPCKTTRKRHCKGRPNGAGNALRMSTGATPTRDRDRFQSGYRANHIMREQLRLKGQNTHIMHDEPFSRLVLVFLIHESGKMSFTAAATWLVMRPFVSLFAGVKFRNWALTEERYHSYEFDQVLFHQVDAVAAVQEKVRREKAGNAAANNTNFHVQINFFFFFSSTNFAIYVVTMQTIPRSLGRVFQRLPPLSSTQLKLESNVFLISSSISTSSSISMSTSSRIRSCHYSICNFKFLL